MQNYDNNIAMIAAVATAMGAELCNDVAFVGGCTTGLLLTDDYTRQQVRHTEDVDLIVHVISKAGWHELLEKLRSKGFKENMLADGPICAMYLNNFLRVDFMPDDASILSFTNSWYKDAFQSATNYSINQHQSIRLVRPEYFVATKLEAYLGRGNNDPLGSRDIEDILILFDGRAELMAEILYAPKLLQNFVSQQLTDLLQSRDFDYAVQSTANGDSVREAIIFKRIELAISYARR